MKFLIIDNTNPQHARFNQPLISLVSAHAEYDVVHYSQIPEPGIVAANYSAIIISGVPIRYGFKSLNTRLPYFEWLLETPLPVLGICLGHQLIGTLFGGSVIKNSEAEKGAIAVWMQQDDPLFANLPPALAVHMMHRASVAAPGNFTILANTSTCQNAIMRHTTKPIYGFQFHPEFSQDGTRLFSNFVQLAAELQQTADSPISLSASGIELVPKPTI